MSVTIKSQREIELMRHAGKLLGQTLKQLEEAVRPGMSTWELNQIGEEIIRGYGCIPSFLNYNGYPASICISLNDEVVHGKATILQKMNGEYEDKFPQARAMYLYMMAHPGKKLNFMGNEFGQLREWDESREQDWDILKYPLHDAFHRYMIELNRIGQENDAFWHDYDPENFKWLDCHQEERCIYAIKRKGKNKNFIAIFNFSDEEQEDYELDTEEEGKLSVILDTDWDEYGGNTKKKKTIA